MNKPSPAVFSRFAPAQVPAASPPREPADPAYAVLPHLRRLAAALPAALRFRETCRALEERHLRKHGGEPELFYFDRRLQRQLEVRRPVPPPSGLPPHGLEAARKRPRGADAWRTATALARELFPVLLRSVDARRAARGLPGLCEQVARLAADWPELKDFADLLAVPDDEVLVVLHPESCRGYRVQVHGVADNYQLQTLLADALADDLLPGPRPDARVVAAYRGWAIPSQGLIGHASFGMFQGRALREDGTLPPGLSGSDGWIWGHSSPSAIPLVGGARVVLLGPPPYAMSWQVELRFPGLAAELEVVEVLEGEAVRRWLKRPAEAARRAA